MAKTSIGLKNIKIGAIAADGSMGTTLTQIPDTVKGEVVITETDGQNADFFINETDTIYERITTEIGSIEVTGSTYQVSAETLQLLKGGTVATNVFTPSITHTEQEVSVELESRRGYIFKIVRAKLVSKFNWNFSSEELSRIDFTLTMLTPTKADTAPYTITVPAVV